MLSKGHKLTIYSVSKSYWLKLKGYPLMRQNEPQKNIIPSNQGKQ